MILKGIARGDKKFRHFTFDDEEIIKKSGSNFYKVNYGKNKLEGEYAEDEIGYILCDNVIVLGGKKAKPIETQTKPELTQTQTEKPKKTTTKKETKPKTTKKSTKKVSETPDTTPVIDSNTFEYYVSELHSDNTEELQDKLNELGSEGWELCGFDTNKSLFSGIHIIVIFKRRK